MVDKLPVEKLTTHRREISLFCPERGKESDLKKLHPELATTEEFKGLSAPDLRFCWYYAIYFGKAYAENVRVLKSLQFAYYGRVSQKVEQDYKNGIFPEKILVAIRKFESYDLNARIEARWITEKVLQDWKIILRANVEEMDSDEKKEHISMSKIILAGLHDLVKDVESGFGVRETKFEKESTEENLIEKFHEKDKK